MINERLTEYSQGIHVDGDGAVILCDGVAITVDEVVERLTLLDEKCIKYRTALELVKKWGDWFPDEPLPNGWPTHDDEQKTPLSLCEIVNNALEGS